MFSSTLKRQEEDHLINRKVYPEIPPRVEYSPTETGKQLMPALQMMIDWTQTHFEKIMK